MSLDALKIALGCAVPMIRMEIQAYGGPTRPDVEWAREVASDLACESDVLFRRCKPGERRALLNKLARAMAILSFCPGDPGRGGAWSGLLDPPEEVLMMWRNDDDYRRWLIGQALTGLTSPVDFCGTVPRDQQAAVDTAFALADLCMTRLAAERSARNKTDTGDDCPF